MAVLSFHCHLWVVLLSINVQCCVTWMTYRCNISKLEVFDICFHQLAGAVLVGQSSPHLCTSSVWLHQSVAPVSTEALVTKHRLHWIGHVIWTTKNGLPRQSFYGEHIIYTSSSSLSILHAGTHIHQLHQLKWPSTHMVLSKVDQGHDTPPDWEWKRERVHSSTRMNTLVIQHSTPNYSTTKSHTEIRDGLGPGNNSKWQATQYLLVRVRRLREVDWQTLKRC